MNTSQQDNNAIIGFRNISPILADHNQRFPNSACVLLVRDLYARAYADRLPGRLARFADALHPQITIQP